MTISKRESKFELLRIIAMFCIVLYHVTLHGCPFANECNFVNKLFISCFNWMGGFGNSVFMILSGFFLCDKEFNYRKILKVYKVLLFYSFGLAFILFLLKVQILSYNDCKLTHITVNQLLKNLFPFYTNQSWYVVTYIVFLFFVPYLNKIQQRFEQYELKNFCILLIIFGTFIPNLPFEEIYHPAMIYFFIMYFFIASYIKKYFTEFSFTSKKIIFYIISIIGIFVGYVSIVLVIGKRFSISHEIIQKMLCMAGSGCQRILILMLSIFVFLLFNRINIQNRIINLIATTTLGVYLIHDHNYFKYFIYFNVLKMQNYKNSNYLPFYIVTSAILIMIIAIIIDLLRQKIFYLFGRIFQKRG